MLPIQVKKLNALTGHRDCVYALEPTHDNGKFFSAAGDGMVVLWDLEKPDEGELIARLNNSIYALHLLPNNLLVVGHNYDGIHLLDWQQKKKWHRCALQRPLFSILKVWVTNCGLQRVMVALL